MGIISGLVKIAVLGTAVGVGVGGTFYYMKGHPEYTTKIVDQHYERKLQEGELSDLDEKVLRERIDSSKNYLTENMNAGEKFEYFVGNLRESYADLASIDDGVEPSGLSQEVLRLTIDAIRDVLTNKMKSDEKFKYFMKSLQESYSGLKGAKGESKDEERAVVNQEALEEAADKTDEIVIDGMRPMKKFEYFVGELREAYEDLAKSADEANVAVLKGRFGPKEAQCAIIFKENKIYSAILRGDKVYPIQESPSGNLYVGDKDHINGVCWDISKNDFLDLFR